VKALTDLVQSCRGRVADRGAEPLGAESQQGERPAAHPVGGPVAADGIDEFARQPRQ
jgi:hypothetical protein